jgi:deoxyribonuclease V
MWPTDAASLRAVQRDLGAAEPDPWIPASGGMRVAGCWACFPKDTSGRGDRGDPAWVAATVVPTHGSTNAAGGDLDAGADDEVVLTGRAGAAYAPGLLALRLGPLLEQVVRELPVRPDVLLVDATGRDHPRRCGLAVQLGAELGLPTVGVTHRPLLAEGEWPEDRRGAASPVRIGAEPVGHWLRTRTGTRPLVVHPGWRVGFGEAVQVVLATTGRRRTPEPLRRARHLARLARDGAP